jgi:peptide deformylase
VLGEQTVHRCRQVRQVEAGKSVGAVEGEAHVPSEHGPLWPMLYDIVQAGDPVLRRPARPLAAEEIPTPFVQELIVSMRQTMHAAPGVGLAAPQVGESLQVVVMEDPAESMSAARSDELGRIGLPFTVLINPTVAPLGDETEEYFEGCLSVTGFMGLVRRWRRVAVHALDATGAPVRLELDGWPARIVQHEADHLAGTLYVDRMDTRSFTTVGNLGRWWKARPAAENRAALSDD